MPLLTSSINKALVLRGVTAAQHPALHGRVLHEREERVNLSVQKSMPVVVTMRVVRSNSTGLLNFEYRLTMAESEYDGGVRLSVAAFGTGAQVTFADFRVDGPGVQPPNYFESEQHEAAAFRFDHGLPAGSGTRFCTMATTAREFQETGGTLKLITGRTSVSLDVPKPLGSGVFKPMSRQADDVSSDDGKGVSGERQTAIL